MLTMLQNAAARKGGLRRIAMRKHGAMHKRRALNAAGFKGAAIDAQELLGTVFKPLLVSPLLANVHKLERTQRASKCV